MSERLFGRLAARLRAAPQVLASVLHTRGATPRKAGARMLIGAADSEFSIGGGLAEARVLTAARSLLIDAERAALLTIDLSGGVDSAGICGGQMQIALRRWEGAADLARARAIADDLTAGLEVPLSADDVGDSRGALRIEPDPRLLIVGGGHCGMALYELARHLDFELWLFDPRPEYADPALYPGATVRGGDFACLAEAIATRRAFHAVLLNRDFASDVATLRELAGADLAFLGMMGSRKRIGAVLAELSPGQAQQLAQLKAPVGLEIGAQTPHEIAVSILAELIQARSMQRSGGLEGLA
ncbi:MAG: XdhC family protein [Lysobacterales bacterium]